MGTLFIFFIHCLHILFSVARSSLRSPVPIHNLRSFGVWWRQLSVVGRGKLWWNPYDQIDKHKRGLGQKMCFWTSRGRFQPIQSFHHSKLNYYYIHSDTLIIFWFCFSAIRSYLLFLRSLSSFSSLILFLFLHYLFELSYRKFLFLFRSFLLFYSLSSFSSASSSITSLWFSSRLASIDFLLV